jgi:hypothetical protein
LTRWQETQSSSCSSKAWRRLSAGDGAKGPRLYDWAYLPYSATTACGFKPGLLFRRQLKQPKEFTFYLTLSPPRTTLAQLVRVAGSRWTIEICFEAAKGEVGLYHYEVRSWTGWHRHITLAMLAHAYLAVLRKAAAGEKIRSANRNRPRSAAGLAAAHGTRTAPAGLDASARPRTRPRLVGVAAATTSNAPAVVIGGDGPIAINSGCSTS